MNSLNRLDELLGNAETLQENIESAYNRMDEINCQFKRKNEDRTLSLDDIPFGEEAIRMGETEEELKVIISDLKAMNKNLADEEKLNTFEEKIEDAKNTFDECTYHLPSEENDEDEDEE